MSAHIIGMAYSYHLPRCDIDSWVQFSNENFDTLHRHYYTTLPPSLSTVYEQKIGQKCGEVEITLYPTAWI